jgi:glycosyltransferase involved in cell wall biosynthesis
MIYEGMAMSVVEAMQLGLVPIVTPVGEPARYCRNMENAVIFSDFDQAVDEVCRLIDEPELYAKVSRAAVATWTDAPIYADDFVAAATELWRRRQGG